MTVRNGQAGFFTDEELADRRRAVALRTPASDPRRRPA